MVDICLKCEEQNKWCEIDTLQTRLPEKLV